MIQFQQQEIEKLAAITGLTPMQVSKLLAMGLINRQEALSAMLVYDWRRLKQRGKYKVAQIFAALSERYGVPKWRVEKAVYYKKKSTQKYCTLPRPNRRLIFHPCQLSTLISFNTNICRS